MAIFVTGSTGYLGSYVVAGLLRDYRDSLNLLVRANSRQEAHERLWHSLQLHFDFPAFFDHIRDRKSTRLNSSHANISYAVFCLKKKKKTRPRLKRGIAIGMATRDVTTSRIDSD